MGILHTITEELKKPIYSKQEADIEKKKKLSTSSTEKDVETNYISYDPFSAYTNSSLEEHTSFANRREMIGKWRKSVWNPEVDEAINEIISEAIVFDEQEPVIDINLDELEMSDKIKDKIIDSFKNILFLLEFNLKGEDIFKKWYVDGQLNIEVVYDNAKIKEGIQKLIVLSPFNIWKIKNKATGEFKYIIKDEKPTNNFVQDTKKAERVFDVEQITQIVSGMWSGDGNTPMSYLQKVVKPINQLNLLEDSVVIWHITRSPEKRVFYIDTGNLPKSKAEEYIKRLIAKYRQKKVYNSDDGSLENRSKSISILEDFWLPRNAQGRGTQIDTLAAQSGGMENMDHIDYFVNKIYKGMNIPRSRRDQEDRIQINNSIDVEKDELKFFKFILRLRRRFNNMFIDLLKKDLLAKKVIKLQDWETIQEHIKFKYANNNPYSDIKKLQLLEMRMGIAANAMDMIENDFLSKDWVRREILAQSEEEIKKIKKEREKEKQEGDDVNSDDDNQWGNEPQTYAQPEPKAPEQPQKSDEPPVENGFQQTKEQKPSYLTSSLKEELSALIRQEVQNAFNEIKVLENNKKKADIINSLKEGDIISNGSEKFILSNGKLVPYKED